MHGAQWLGGADGCVVLPGLIKTFLKDVEWGSLDYLIIDSMWRCCCCVCACV